VQFFLISMSLFTYIVKKNIKKHVYIKLGSYLKYKKLDIPFLNGWNLTKCLTFF